MLMVVGCCTEHDQGGKMIERVRAVLVTPDDRMLAIRRDRPGQATYWALPGGHVDAGDRTRETALSREISEEIAGEAEITSLLYVLDSESGDERQYFYLGRIASWSFESRTGPEFTETGRGTYELDQIPLTDAGLGAIDLKPAEVAVLLRDAIASGRDLFTLPDLRSVPAAHAPARNAKG
jgi:ADP-ribose pyrophosphatase YjhB (NUDIX family)